MSSKFKHRKTSGLPPIPHGEQKAEEEAQKRFLTEALRKKKPKKGPDPYKEQENA